MTIANLTAQDIVANNPTAQQVLAFLNEQNSCVIEDDIITFGIGDNSRFILTLDMSGEQPRIQGGEFSGDLRELDAFNTILMICRKPLPEAIAASWEASARRMTESFAHRSLREVEDLLAGIARDFGGQAVAAYLLQLAEEVKETRRVSFKSQDESRFSEISRQEFRPWYNG